ncbi:hypothetical protein [Streptomyces boninensis]|uniref:hypothetical protein n=1 Tax=Streptomyces boninensis TaxID=2039455 RepID=UPI003B228A6C
MASNSSRLRAERRNSARCGTHDPTAPSSTSCPQAQGMYKGGFAEVLDAPKPGHIGTLIVRAIAP